MGVTKKPAVVAKTAAKKRGRPVGSKNKSKPAGKKLAALGGSLSSAGWVPPSVDWEKLSKQLQQALAKEMHLNQRYENARFMDRLSFLFTGKI